MAGAGGDPRAAQARAGRAAPAVRRARRGRLHRDRARRARGARLARSADRPAARARRAGQAPAGGRVPGHLQLAVGAARAPHRRLGGGRRQDGVRGRRPDAVHLSLSRRAGGPLPARAARGPAERCARAVGAVDQLPLPGRAGRVGQPRLSHRSAGGRGRGLGRGAVFALDRVRGGGPRRRADAGSACRPRRRGAPRGGTHRPIARQDRDPGAQPQPPRPHRAAAEGSRHQVPRGRNRAARREASGAGPLCVDARADAPGRPRRLARHPARTVVRPGLE